MSMHNNAVKNNLPGGQTLTQLLEVAIEAAQSAGQILVHHYGKPHDIVKKGAVDLVTEADLASEKAIVALLQHKTPQITIMAEEQSDSHTLNQTETLWVVDPLDGTTNFAHGFPFFSVSIALLQAGKPLVGVVYAPMLEELFCAQTGGGATLNNTPIRTSTADTLIEALVATGFPYERRAQLPRIMQQLQAVLHHVQDVRRAGSAAIDLAYVACGRLDAYYEVQLSPWDTAAGWLLVEEAGGRVTGIDGAAYSPFIPQILASNGHVHGALRQLLV
ncbi:MAG: inositol monophosphatase family protein [Desulfobulbus sp.]|jgi:myo-inositol-1(or 4)-monophosphatase